MAGNLRRCAGLDHLNKIAEEAGLDRKRVAIAGHSAGGQLALWVASQRRDAVSGVVSLSGVPDLRGAHQSVCPGIDPRLVRRRKLCRRHRRSEVLPAGCRSGLSPRSSTTLCRQSGPTSMRWRRGRWGRPRAVGDGEGRGALRVDCPDCAGLWAGARGGAGGTGRSSSSPQAFTQVWPRVRQPPELKQARDSPPAKAAIQSTRYRHKASTAVIRRQHR